MSDKFLISGWPTLQSCIKTSLLGCLQINSIIYLSAWIFDRLSFDKGFCLKLLFSAVQEQKGDQITMIEVSKFVYSHTPWTWTSKDEKQLKFFKFKVSRQ